MKTTTPPLLGSLATVVLLCFAALPTAVAEDGGLPGNNTAEGAGTLVSLTSGTGNTGMGFEALNLDANGSGNTGIGSIALNVNTSGSMNTGTGFQVLFHNNGSNNTATGANALFNNFTGHENTANGEEALVGNFSGSGNTAIGYQALFDNDGTNNVASGIRALLSNTGGSYNTGTGGFALSANTSGSNNTATGIAALGSNTIGNSNTGTGQDALLRNTTGNLNTAEGSEALAFNTSGSNNVAVGFNAGNKLTTGSNNIDIGANVIGVSGEANTIRIGKSGAQQKTFIAGISGKTVASGVGVVINSQGQLGTVQSSARVKEAIKPMDKASEALLKLKPVTFHYSAELDPNKVPQFGLIAEQVERVDPNLVIRDEDGKVSTVRYEAVNAMLLNEFLKEHRKVEEQQAAISDLKSTTAQQQKQIEGLTSHLQQVSDQVQARQATLVAGN